LRLQEGNHLEQTLLYAGNPVYPAVLIQMSHPFHRVKEMDSDNPTGADNQQERPSFSTWLDRVPNDLGHWISGFVEGEGSFNVPIRRERDRGLPSWANGSSRSLTGFHREAPSGQTFRSSVRSPSSSFQGGTFQLRASSESSSRGDR